MKYLGAAYYPEYWMPLQPGRVEIDAKLMREAGMNLVRIGEFAWARMEPQEGVFTLDWLRECIGTLEKYGVSVLLCTPTAAPPAWLTCNYPETLLLDANYTKMEHGRRLHYCYCSETYWRHTERIVDKLASEFANHKNIAGWQLDNEPAGGYCYCETCQKKFREWLRGRYGSVEELNRAWGTGFWTQDYSEWRQVRLGRVDGNCGPGRMQDTRHFQSDALVGYICAQADVIRRHNPDAIISTNLDGGIFTQLDYYKMYSKMNIAMKDLYFDICPMDTNVMILNQFRSYKPGVKFWITETGAGTCGNFKPSSKEQFRAWLWSSYAHGADAFTVFRWRTCLSGCEHELEGLLEHSGHPGHRYQKAKAAFLEMRELTGRLGDLAPETVQTAMIHDYENKWIYDSFYDHNRFLRHEANFTRMYKELYRRQVPADIISMDAPLDGYKLVILPSLTMVTEAFAAKLSKFAENGGVIFAQGQLGMRDALGNYLITRGPQYLEDLFGLYICGGMFLYSATEADESHSNVNPVSLRVSGMLGHSHILGEVSVWAGDLELNGAAPLLTYTGGQFRDQAAVTEKQAGKGSVLYAAAAGFDDALWGALFEYVFGKAGVGYMTGIPEHVEIIRRGSRLFIINHLNKQVNISLEGSFTAIAGPYDNGRLRLEPYAVTILEDCGKSFLKTGPPSRNE